jgi:hypothetical protein
MILRTPILLAIALVIVQGVSARAELVSIDFLLPGDELVTRDTETGMDWLDLSFTADFSPTALADGAYGFLAEGWRHATTDEVCGLMVTLGLGFSPCPGYSYANTEGSEDLSFELFGRVIGPSSGFGYTSQWQVGVFRDAAGGFGKVEIAVRSNAEGWLDTYSSVFENLGPGFPYGNYLVREIPFRIDDYKVYAVANPYPSLRVLSYLEMQDRFGSSFNRPDYRNKFATPAYGKFHGGQPAFHPGEHLSWRELDAPQPFGALSISLENRFGPNQSWVIGEAKYMLLPATTEVDENGFPFGIEVNQRYMCYVALIGGALDTNIELTDIFGVAAHDVGERRYFCTPAEYFGVQYEIAASGPAPLPNESLACYEISPGPAETTGVLAVNDDFDVGALTHTITSAEMLCVRSTLNSSTPGLPTMDFRGFILTIALLSLTGAATLRGKLGTWGSVG